MNQFKTLGLLKWRSPPAISGMVACLDLLRQLLLPAIFSIVAPVYRRVIHLAPGNPTLVPICWARSKLVR